LASVAACRNERALVTLDPPPPETREAIRAVRADVTRANNLERAGRYDQGLALAQAAVERAEALEWPPLAGAAKLERGALLDRVGRYAEAETALEDAYFAAGGGAAPDVAVDAAIELVRLVGIQLERIDDARRWGRHAEAALAAIDDGEGLSRASLRANLGFVDSIAGDQEQAMRLLEQALATRARTQGDGHPAVIAVLHELALVHQTMADFDQALALEQRVLDLATQALGPDHPNVAATLNALAAFHVQRGDYAKAQAMLEQTLAARERVLGTEHPELANLLDNLAIIHYTVGDYEKARLLFERSLALTEKAAGPQSPSVSGTLANLAQLHYMIEDYEQAKALFERALAIREKALGPEHATVAAILDGLGDVYWYTGAQDEAAVLYERASTIHEKALGPDHPDLAGSLSRLARARRRTGAYDEARALYTRVLAIYERALGLDHPTTAHALLGIAELELEQHRPAEALPLAQRALAMFEKHGVEPYNTAMARFRLAQALWDLPADGGRDRPRAMQLVEQARDRFRAIGQGGTEGLSVVDAWLAAHREEGRGRSTDRPPLPERPRR
jgi:tetratricopeptide (TPR) repeat protein